ncbi:MAG: hypothetical protein A2X86_17905 [Bdellovibrionales bacterium GWA2_49_15]|nr:MAG: hypothetical protein A2X86_17905 [Bdellovibrionales bacterium GWA2_49_15]HAZ11599.1 hypothetical protein [Bdellovibrionales bacterium]
MKKVLVHGSSSVEQLILSFPALHALKKESTDDEIYLAVFEHTKEAVKFLALDVKPIFLPEKYGNIFDAHRFAANLKSLANVDCFLDFESSMTSAFAGYNLKSPVRIGLKKGAAKYLRGENISRYDFYDTAAVGLVEQYLKKPLHEMKVMASGKKPIAVDDIFIKEEFVPDYLLIVLNELSFLNQHAAFFRSLFDGIENTTIRIVYCDRGDLTLQLNEIRDLHAAYNSTNKYEYGFVSDHTFLINQIIQSKGVITEKTWHSLICSYYGITSFSLEGVWPMLSQYFVAEMHSFEIRGKEEIKMIGKDGEMAVSTFVDFMHERFKI